MTHKQAVEAYKTIEKLSTQPLPVKAAYALHKLRRTLTPEWDFQMQRERQLLDKLKPSLVEGTKVTFSSAEDATEWRDSMDELNVMEFEYNEEPITVSVGKDARLTLDDIDALDGFVIFEE